MRCFLCISLIILYLLNLVGGHWVFYALQVKNQEALAEQLDVDHYAGSQAITIKLPVSVSSEADKGNYERVDAEFVYEGVTYRTIKQKFYQDTVYIVCYKDDRSIAIKTAFEDYVKTFTDSPTEKKSDNKTHGISIKDYLVQHKTELSQDRHAIDIYASSAYLNDYSYSPNIRFDQPPELLG